MPPKAGARIVTAAADTLKKEGEVVDCRYCGRKSEDGSGVCDRCEAELEKERDYWDD